MGLDPCKGVEVVTTQLYMVSGAPAAAPAHVQDKGVRVPDPLAWVCEVVDICGAHLFGHCRLCSNQLHRPILGSGLEGRGVVLPLLVLLVVPAGVEAAGRKLHRLQSGLAP